MMERPADTEQPAMPDDIATLCSRLNVQGSKYRDFSASRKQARGEFRHALREEVEQAGAEQPAVVPSSQLAEPGQTSHLQVSPFPTTEWKPPMPDSPATAPPSRAVPIWETQPLPRKEVPGRWFAVHAVFSPADVAPEAPSAPQISLQRQPPMLAVFSLAGGVGKTCLVATLGRALSGLGEHVLLADTAVCGLLPFYFGSREFKLGVVRTFSSPGAESDAPVNVLNLEAERFPGGGGQRDALLGELVSDGRGASRILVDIATASLDVTRRLLLLRPVVLVPLLPDMSSLASLTPLDAFLTGLAGREGGTEQTLYLLNQFDVSSSLHRDVRAMLQERLGDRLLPFVLRRSAAVSEALAEGMTVIDYAPGSAAAEDYRNLAGWLRGFAAPAAVGYGGVRWSER